MKCCYFFLLAILFFHEILALNITDDCEQNDNDDHWICDKNEDSTLNLTYDCSLNDDNKTFEVELWSLPFPSTMKSLKIQNCNQVIVYSICSRTINSKTFKYLHILNISKFSLMRRKEPAYDSYKGLTSLGSDFDDHFVRSYRHRLPARLPQNVIFQNIISAEFSVSLISEDSYYWSSCGTTYEEAGIESLKFINVAIDRLDRLCYAPRTSGNMRELIFKNVTIKEVTNKAIHIHSDNATMEIINSKFDEIYETFAEYKASKVLISDNSFNELSERSFKGDSEEFIFSSNRVHRLDTSAFKIRSRIIKIVNNTFDDIRSNFFEGIKGIPFSPNFTPGLFNFSGNIMHNLAPDALSYEEVKAGESYFFDNLIITNNLISCSCGNVLWFDHLKTSPNRNFPTKFLRYQLLNVGNRNRCLNVKNCELNEVLNNYHELCMKNYVCPNVTTTLKKNLYDEDTLLDFQSNLPQVNVSTNQNFSGISNELRNLLGIQNRSYLEVQKVFQYLEPMLSCFYVITIVLCLSLGFAVIRKCYTIPFYRILSIIRRARNFCMNRPTELNMSCVSLTA